MNKVNLPLTVGETGLEEARTVSHSQQTLTHVTTPLDANLTGNVFGGVILAAVCTLAADGATPALEALEFEFKMILGEGGYQELREAVKNGVRG